MTARNSSKLNKKILKKSLLRSGLASEFFLLSFIKPDKPYEIAKIIKNVEEYPDASKMYSARDRLVEQGYLEEKGSLYYPIYSKLAQEMTLLFYEEQNETLDENEINILEYFLKNTKFLRLLHEKVRQIIHAQDKGIRNIDALKVIASQIGSVSLFLWYMQQNKMANDEKALQEQSKQISTKDLEQFELQWTQLSDIIMEKFRDHFTDKITISNDPDLIEFDGLNKDNIIELIFSSIPIFLLMMDVEFLRKLSTMGNGQNAMDALQIILDLQHAN